MARVLVTGGTGRLGRRVVSLLLEHGHQPIVLSRRANARLPESVPLLVGDLADPVAGDRIVVEARAEVIVNAASSTVRNSRRVDVDGACLLAEAAMRRGGLRHFIHVGIVGDDRIPLGYYETKAAAERALKGISGLPLTVQRATQFHSLLGEPLLKLRWVPFVVLDKSLLFQVMDATEAAARVASLVDAAPVNGRAPDIGGPVVHTLGELSNAVGLRVLGVRFPGRVAAGFRQGLNTCPDQAVGRITFGDWLSRRAAAHERQKMSR